MSSQAPGFVQTRAIGPGAIEFGKLSSRLRRHTFDRFDVRPIFTAGVGHGAPTGAAGNINIVDTGRGRYEHIVIGTQTLVAPAVWDATNGNGYDIAQDLTATDGAEWDFGSNIVTAGGSRGRHNYVIGTDPAFFARLKIKVTDASGFNPFLFGFRRVQAHQTTFTNYTDYAVFELQSDLDIILNTNLNNGGAASVDTTQNTADNTTIEMRVDVDQQGRVRFMLNNGGSALAFPTVTKTNFQFDSGDIVLPFAYLIHGADVAETTWLQEFEAGYIPRGL